MPNLKVEGAIVDNGRVLLVQDADMPCWRMPGGPLEANESLNDGVVRLVKSETGFDVRPGRLVGLYCRPTWRSGGDVTCVFSCFPITRRPTGMASLTGGYFLPQALPSSLYPCQSERLADTFAGQQRTVVRDQDVRWPFASDDLAHVLDTLVSQGLSTRENAFREVIRRLQLPVSDEELAAWLREKG
jgi:ADP-ribose pyrophosphatase YjhB (NUDIX family)